MQIEAPDTHTDTHQPGKEKHISEGVYFAVFLLLAGLTITELIVTYLPPFFKVPLLLGLATTKAYIVVQFYMHLRYDNKLFSWVILAPVIAGAIMTLILQALVMAGYV